MNAHTPTPWHAVISRDGLPYIVDDRNGFNQSTIVESPKSHQDHEQDAADCIHICRAVNSHDALLAACQELLSMVDELLPLAPKGCRWGTLSTDDARQAIALATGNTIATPAVSENLNQPLN